MLSQIQTSSSPTHVGKPTAINKHLLEHTLLPQVFKPGRYMGLEQGAFRKDFEKATVRMALAFPDLYEIGISNYALKLFYSLINQQPRYLCDRVYAAAPDMRAKLAAHNVPLYGVETMQPLAHFDVIAFTLAYELNYTTILGMLESTQMPLRSKDRYQQYYPLLIAGGPGAGNPMPLAPFFDVFINGDGEEVLIEILDLVEHAKAGNWSKPKLIEALANIDGLYVPGITEKCYKRIVDIAKHQVDMAPLIPAVEAVHDRVTIEARRGCDRMCRFCQPCFINLPAREQNIDAIKEKALKELERTGYEECSLLSLSIADYSDLKPLVLNVASALKEKNASLSLPSQRADRFNLDVAEAVQSVRKSTLTFAPEAGTERLRNVVNKNLTDAEIMNAVTTAYKAGWNKVKLYFMIGLPTETTEDLDGIVEIVRRMKATCKQLKREANLSVRDFLDVNVTISNFVPKPHTPFQWCAQDTMEQLREKTQYLRQAFKGTPGVKLNFTDPEISKLEAVISRGGPELAEVLESAYKRGAYLDAWDDLSNFDRWFEALTEAGIDWETYTRERCIHFHESLPWDAIDVGLSKEWLIAEYEKAMVSAGTVPCFDACSTCGVCATYGVQPIFTDASTEAPRVAMHTLKAQAEKLAEKEAADNTGEETIEQTPSQPTLNQYGINTAAKSKQMNLEPKARVRLTLQKVGGLRFISHLDWLRMLQRAVSRAQWPVAYTQGFNPKPKFSFSPALPLFVEGWQEFLDIDLTEIPKDTNMLLDLMKRLSTFLPAEGQVKGIQLLTLQTKTLDKTLQSSVYKAIFTPVDREPTQKNSSNQLSSPQAESDPSCADPALRSMIGTTLPEFAQEWLQNILSADHFMVDPTEVKAVSVQAGRTQGNVQDKPSEENNTEPLPQPTVNGFKKTKKQKTIDLVAALKSNAVQVLGYEDNAIRFQINRTQFLGKSTETHKTSSEISASHEPSSTTVEDASPAGYTLDYDWFKPQWLLTPLAQALNTKLSPNANKTLDYRLIREALQ